MMIPDPDQETKSTLVWPGLVFSWFKKTMRYGESKTRRGDRQKKGWEDNIKMWTGPDFASSTRVAEKRRRWKGLVTKSSVVPR